MAVARVGADFKVVWYGGFEHAIVRANSQHAALWFGRYLDRAGMAVWKLNMSGSGADKFVQSAEGAAFTVETIDLESLRPIKREKPPSRTENETQKMNFKEVK